MRHTLSFFLHIKVNMWPSHSKAQILYRSGTNRHETVPLNVNKAERLTLSWSTIQQFRTDNIEFNIYGTYWDYEKIRRQFSVQEINLMRMWHCFSDTTMQERMIPFLPPFFKRESESYWFDYADV